VGGNLIKKPGFAISNARLCFFENGFWWRNWRPTEEPSEAVPVGFLGKKRG